MTLYPWDCLLCMIQTQHEETERAAAEVAQAQAELAAVRKRQLEQIAGATGGLHMLRCFCWQKVSSAVCTAALLEALCACRTVALLLAWHAAASAGHRKVCHTIACRDAVLKQLLNIC